MHEVSIVSALIEELDQQLAAQGVERVRQLRLRRGSTFSAEALQQAFQALSAGTRLAGADLVVETVTTQFTCAQCGHSQPIDSDDLIGHMFLCPECSHVQEIDEVHDLAVLAVTAAGSGTISDTIS